MKKSCFGVIVVTALVLLTGCATPQQAPIALSKTSISAESGRIGVVMTTLPQLDTQVPGAGCLLCLAVAIQMNSGLTTHARTLGYEDLPQFKHEVAALLRKNGASVIVLDETLNISTLPDHAGAAPNAATKSFAAFKQKYQIDKLLVLNISALGFTRSYANYIPTSDPKGLFEAAGYMVNLSTNGYEWYEPVVINKGTDQKWDEPPKFPGLTNAYYQALEMGKDQLIKPLLASGDVIRTQAAAPVAPKVIAVVPNTPAPTIPAITTSSSKAVQASVVTGSTRMSPNTGKKPQVGDEWEYLAADKIYGKRKKLVWRTKSVEVDGVVEEVVIDGIPSQPWLYKNQPEVIAVPTEAGFVFSPHWDTQSSIPEMKVKGAGECSQRLQCVVQVKHAGAERISTNAGTFDAIRIDGTLVFNANPIVQVRGQITAWYSEKDRRLIKQTVTMRTSAASIDEVLELQSARSLQ